MVHGGDNGEVHAHSEDEVVKPSFIFEQTSAMLTNLVVGPNGEKLPKFEQVMAVCSNRNQDAL